MKDDGACSRCGEPLGSNAALCWWCEFYLASVRFPIAAALESVPLLVAPGEPQ